MEKQPDDTSRVQITRAVFDGLEFIKRSGLTNMLDRQVVIQLAREWDLTETADWIDSVNTGTYGRLILQGPEVIEDDLPDQGAKHDQSPQVNDSEMTGDTIDQTRWQNVIASLGQRATATLADTYETEMMGVLTGSPYQDQINVERTELIRNLAEASSLWVQLEETMNAVERGIVSLQFMIDPENN